MKHPKREEWVPYIFGEATPDERRKLAEHLQGCRDCAWEIAGWQRSLKKLNGWTVPAPRPRFSGGTASLLKWGVAAALVLSAGFGLGRVSAPPAADLNTMRAELEASLQESLAPGIRKDLNTDLQSALAATRIQITNEFQTQLNLALADTANVSASHARRQLNEFIEVWNGAREDDRRSVFALLEKIQKQHAAEYLSLRNDLETVAALTDEEIRRARQTLIQLAANRSPTQP